MPLIHFMPVEFIPGLGSLPADSAHLPQLWHTLASSSTSMTVLAQQFDTNVFGDFWTTWDNFIESGQVWALLIGLVLGYLIRGFTSYG
jgi:hypothetical protein